MEFKHSNWQFQLLGPLSTNQKDTILAYLKLCSDRILSKSWRSHLMTNWHQAQLVPLASIYLVDSVNLKKGNLIITFQSTQSSLVFQAEMAQSCSSTGLQNDSLNFSYSYTMFALT